MRIAPHWGTGHSTVCGKLCRVGRQCSEAGGSLRVASCAHGAWASLLRPYAVWQLCTGPHGPRAAPSAHPISGPFQSPVHGHCTPA